MVFFLKFNGVAKASLAIFVLGSIRVDNDVLMVPVHQGVFGPCFFHIIYDDRVGGSPVGGSWNRVRDGIFRDDFAQLVFLKVEVARVAVLHPSIPVGEDLVLNSKNCSEAVFLEN